ncbi:dimethyl sulfoxide reductase anchor subunit family protein [Thiolinea disciformis]|uniref:dimethyl sulfoxide reductase anchor subunit family protein n=1 Tax=Thiolinea disciformis TaxID=125614 RepID=UPI0003623FDD|nr:DmsC/YnfH family molybdoenzyme membrane anchor subunit [Thiolinea disciformis]
MHPAFSVIFFTVSSGAGYGLFIWLAIAQLFGLASLNTKTTLIAGGIALVLITAGLLSSTLHLANPKNAWRAVMRFKTSWLSREGVFAILFYPSALLYLLAIFMSDHETTTFIKLLALSVIIIGLATVFSTGMIYACLKTIRQWHTALTPANYILMSLTSGAVLLTLVLLSNKVFAASMAITGIGLLILTALTKAIYYFWVHKVTGPTINTATGFTRAQVRLLDTGHSAGTFLNQEFGYQADPSLLKNLKVGVFVLAFFVPSLLLAGVATDYLGVGAALLAFASVLAGLGAERWLFFAEARHVIRLYHGAQHT